MDDVDRAILHQLQLDARLSNVELAERVRLSPSPCLRRVRNLESAGVILGYHAEVDPAAVGLGFQVLVHANMGVKNQAIIEAFEARVREIDQILECRRMFGDPDYLLWVVAEDAEDYERLYMSDLASLPGVARMNSQITMKTIKKTTGFPLADS
ncbi:AsnC family transcriptional regulator [Sphaerisporangium melleum]|uniref:AsnC family transcriptional regulator n=1 Tax=Sphaerisporangium melleum TaxID=321316 RepID=A0A917VU88_9ACTN|nr:Lrp/AsnC family transcriptional regulator [Sphaerisporangium melleum]GGL19047.1 AsnC family transcriptional regulator [Sphaerisporangium melleum]GII71137.1 AsnC family transcriptional regulator [Sphaerisporangium melleum]